MNKKAKTKIVFSIFLTLVILSSSIYFLMPDTMKILIEDTRTKYFVYDDGWILSATEYVNLYSGTTKMRAKSREVIWWNDSKNVYTQRTSYWKDDITTIQTYTFSQTSGQIEQFPIKNEFQCLNCEGKIVHYEIRDIKYDGETKKITSPFSFGHNMEIEWGEGNYYAKVFQQKIASDKIIIKYRPQDSDEIYNVRLFDPIQNWTIEGDLVYFEDSNAFLSAYPHTVTSSQWVYFNLTSYNQSGNIDAVWGFKGDSVKPKRAELYKPHYVNWTTDHSQTFLNVSAFNLSDEPCNYGDKDNDKSVNITYQICGEYNYTEMESECLYWNTTNSIVCFDSREPTTQPPTPNLNYTFYWHTEHSRLENWVDISNKFTSKDWNYQNMTKWWLLKNVTIQKDINYQIRAWVDVPISLNGVNGKYFWAVKPTNMDLPTAKDKGYFYALDPWFNSSWQYKKNITINHSKVNGSQVNFPVLINLTDTDLRDDAQADGDDIVFTNSTGSQLDHEIEYFNSTDGRLVAWVRIPTLSNTTDTVIQMYYGNAGASNQENATGVWDDNYVMVQHMQETPTAYMNDSTSNNNDGTTSGMDSADQVAGQIDGSLDFDGGDDYVWMGNTSINFQTNYTVDAWINTDVLSVTQTILGDDLAWDNEDFNIRIDSLGKIQWLGNTVGGGGVLKTSNSSLVTAGKRHHIVIIINKGTDRISGFADGTSISWDSTDISTATVRGTPELFIGSQRGSMDYFNGIIDEVRISNVARTAGWIATEYNNQYSPDSFYSVGGEETGDDTYPQFSNYQDNNNTLTDSGTGLFNVTVENTNGTVLLEIDGYNITATNVSNVFNVSYVFSSAGTYLYKWHSWGNGTNANYNVSVERDYLVNSSAVDTCTYTSNNWEVDCSDNCIITENIDVGGNNISITGTGTFKINGGNVSNYEELYIKGTDSNNICEIICSGGCFI